MPAMNRHPHHADDTLENDAVWKLLDHSPAATAGPRFVDDTLRAARLACQTQPWWKRLLAPAPLAGLAAASAAVAIAITGLIQEKPGDPGRTTAAEVSVLMEIQDLAETEILLTAVDYLDKFSDTELVSLIGF